MTKEWTGGYRIWASFTFLLRSMADCHALGFENVSLHNSPPPPEPEKSNRTVAPSRAGYTKGPSLTGNPQADDSVDALFVDDEENSANGSAANATSEKPEDYTSSQSTLSSLLSNLLYNKRDTLNPLVEEYTLGEQALMVGSMESCQRSESEAREKRPLFLPGVKGAPAYHAFLERAPTEEPEPEPETEPTPASPPNGSLSEILIYSISCTQPPTPCMSGHNGSASALAERPQACLPVETSSLLYPGMSTQVCRSGSVGAFSTKSHSLPPRIVTHESQASE